MRCGCGWRVGTSSSSTFLPPLLALLASRPSSASRLAAAEEGGPCLHRGLSAQARPAQSSRLGSYRTSLRTTEHQLATAMTTCWPASTLHVDHHSPKSALATASSFAKSGWLRYRSWPAEADSVCTSAATAGSSVIESKILARTTVRAEGPAAPALAAGAPCEPSSNVWCDSGKGNHGSQNLKMVDQVRVHASVPVGLQRNLTNLEALSGLTEYFRSSADTNSSSVTCSRSDRVITRQRASRTMARCGSLCKCSK